MNMFQLDLRTLALLLLEKFRDDVLNPDIVKFETLKNVYSEDETIEFLNAEVDVSKRVLRVL